MSQALTTIPKLRFSEPKRNLPGRRGRATAEDHFTIAFMRAYLQQAQEIHRRSLRNHMAFAREIPVNGYGIADLIVVAWQGPLAVPIHDVATFIQEAHPLVRAFECKLTDWRQAMRQAGRYRFFSDQTFTVLPPPAAKRALQFLDTFKKIKVGLWSFSQETGRIKVYHSPRPIRLWSERKYSRAIHLVKRASSRSLPIAQRGRARPSQHVL